MSIYFDDLKKLLGNLDKVKTDVEEIRKCKAEIQALKEQLYDTVHTGYYLRDEKRIIISAPEIVIGNVDHNGVLIGGGSNVIIRGNDIELQGTGSALGGGTVLTKAPTIRQIAVDPGPDGNENVVPESGSEIVSQAVSIALESSGAIGSFVSPASDTGRGISLVSDAPIVVNSTPSNNKLSALIDSNLKELDKESKDLANSVKASRKTFESVVDDLKELAEDLSSAGSSQMDWIENDRDITMMSRYFANAKAALCSSVEDYFKFLSIQAETNRRKDALKKMKDELGKKGSNFIKENNGAVISLNSESLVYTSIDGDGNLRENPEAGVFLRAPRLGFTATDSKGALIKDSSMSINVQDFAISTSSAALDDKGEKGDIPAGGSISLTSKTVTLQAVDAEYKDKKVTEKALAKGSKLHVRTENVLLEASDTEGKSTGEIKLNAKNIQLASMNLDKEKRTEKEMAPGSQMVLLSEKMFTGATDKKNKSKLVQIASDKIGIMADTTAEMQQGEAKAVLTLEGGNLDAGASKNTLSGDTTISGKADIKGEATAPKGSFKSLEASSQFKSPSISDGMGAAAGGAAGKPSAKMKMEEVQKKQ